MLKKKFRHRWILNYLQTFKQADILDKNFVEQYCDVVECTYSITFFGAPKCKLLSKDLTELYYKGDIGRIAVSIPNDLSAMGFPKWVYSYYIQPTNGS